MMLKAVCCMVLQLFMIVKENLTHNLSKMSPKMPLKRNQEILLHPFIAYRKFISCSNLNNYVFEVLNNADVEHRSNFRQPQSMFLVIKA